MCGVIGVLGTPQAARRVQAGLTLLQHRGQDAAGILSYDDQLKNGGFHFVRNLGLVDQAVPPSALESLTGTAAIGHTRYSTVGRSELSGVQPFLLNYPYGIGIVHNGNLVNFSKLSKELQEESRRHPLTQSDTETILNLFAEALARASEGQKLNFRHICEAITQVHKRAIGSYSCVALIAGYGIIGFRDPHGIRPLLFARRTENDGKESYLFASESGAAQFLDYQSIQEVGCGELIAVTLDGRVERAKLTTTEGASANRPCMFEWIYFASPQSEIARSPVYRARIQLGRRLAHKVKKAIEAGRIQPDIIVPVPETARIAAIALSEELGLPYRELLIKNRYISRTFILDSQDKREKAVQLKIAPVESEIRGKNILLVDDSIVRGTTSRKLVSLLRHCGAREVTFVSTAPPIRYPCHYGIDFPNREELIAHDKTEAEIEKAMNVDHVIYQDIEDLRSALQPDSDLSLFEKTNTQSNFKPCEACLTGEYPTSVKDYKPRQEKPNATEHVPHL
jgi:amidophosphoribosyltransferase